MCRDAILEYVRIYHNYIDMSVLTYLISKLQNIAILYKTINNLLINHIHITCRQQQKSSLHIFFLQLYMEAFIIIFFSTDNETKTKIIRQIYLLSTSPTLAHMHNKNNEYVYSVIKIIHCLLEHQSITKQMNLLGLYRGRILLKVIKLIFYYLAFKQASSPDTSCFIFYNSILFCYSLPSMFVNCGTITISSSKYTGLQEIGAEIKEIGA